VKLKKEKKRKENQLKSIGNRKMKEIGKKLKLHNKKKKPEQSIEGRNRRE